MQSPLELSPRKISSNVDNKAPSQLPLGGAKDCIRLLAPMSQNEFKTDIINYTRNIALEINGCTVTTIGDGIRDLNQEDLVAFHQAIAESEEPVLLDIRAHGGMLDDEHLIQLGENLFISTQNLVESALEHADDKRVDIISQACESGQFCKTAKLPENIHYLGMSDDAVYTYNIHRLSQTLSEQHMALTAENILKLSLTQNFDVPIGRGTIPHFCTKSGKEGLAELLKKRLGREFSSAEKNHIKGELTSFIKNPEQLIDTIRKIENNEINEGTLHLNTKLYGNALAVVHAVNQYHELHHGADPSHGSEHASQALEIYQDLIHVRDHTIYHNFHAGVPKLLRLPVVGFLVAMSNNTYSEHPIRDSVIDMGVEMTTLTSMGLVIGHVPAALSLLTSHLVEAGLEKFPSWKQIDKMPRTTISERLTYSRMIETRATAELLALPSHATKLLSKYVKSVINNMLTGIGSPAASLKAPELKGLSGSGRNTGWDLIRLKSNFTGNPLADEPASHWTQSSKPHSSHSKALFMQGKTFQANPEQKPTASPIKGKKKVPSPLTKGILAENEKVLKQWNIEAKSLDNQTNLQLQAIFLEQKKMGKAFAVLMQKAKQEETQKRQAQERDAVLMQYTATHSTFAFISALGQATNHQGLQKMGAIGQAGTEIAKNLALLTGAVPNVSLTGLAMIGPMAAIGMAGLSIFQTLRSKKTNGSGLTEALKQISEQINALHQLVLTLGREMHGRFDRLEDIIKRVADNMKLLHDVVINEIQSTHRETKAILTTIQQDLEQLKELFNTGIKEIYLQPFTKHIDHMQQYLRMLGDQDKEIAKELVDLMTWLTETKHLSAVNGFWSLPQNNSAEEAWEADLSRHKNVFEMSQNNSALLAYLAVLASTLPNVTFNNINFEQLPNIELFQLGLEHYLLGRSQLSSQRAHQMDPTYESLHQIRAVITNAINFMTQFEAQKPVIMQGLLHKYVGAQQALINQIEGQTAGLLAKGLLAGLEISPLEALPDFVAFPATITKINSANPDLNLTSAKLVQIIRDKKTALPRLIINALACGIGSISMAYEAKDTPAWFQGGVGGTDRKNRPNAWAWALYDRKVSYTITMDYIFNTSTYRLFTISLNYGGTENSNQSNGGNIFSATANTTNKIPLDEYLTQKWPLAALSNFSELANEIKTVPEELKVPLSAAIAERCLAENLPADVNIQKRIHLINKILMQELIRDKTLLGIYSRNLSLLRQTIIMYVLLLEPSLLSSYQKLASEAEFFLRIQEYILHTPQQLIAPNSKPRISQFLTGSFASFQRELAEAKPANAPPVNPAQAQPQAAHAQEQKAIPQTSLKVAFLAMQQQIDLFQTTEQVKIAAEIAAKEAEAADKAAALVAAENAARAATNAASAATSAAFFATSAVTSVNVVAVTAAAAKAAATTAVVHETALISASNSKKQFKDGREMGAKIAPYVAIQILREKGFDEAASILEAQYPASKIIINSALPEEIQKGILQGLSIASTRIVRILNQTEGNKKAVDCLLEEIPNLVEQAESIDNLATLLKEQRPEIADTPLTQDGTPYSQSTKMRFHQPAPEVQGAPTSSTHQKTQSNEPVHMHVG